MIARRPWALPLVPVYAAISHAAQWYKARKLRKLAWPVLSVGSLSAGGAGKTPVVMALVQLMKHRSWRVDVLSRGYNRMGEEIERVQLNAGKRSETGEEATEALWFGDEPVMIAQSTGAEVWVGSNRYEVGLQAEAYASSSHSGEKKQRRLHLLDDGFQHVQLARQLDAVLITMEDLDDALLPAGNRREPLKALQRADAVVVRENESERILARLEPYLRPSTVVWMIRRRLLFSSPLAVLGAGLRPLAFCAIARPMNFASMVMNAGCGLVETIAFADHHRYTEEDITEIIAVAQRLNATGFVTTEKDGVKLSPTMREALSQVGPLMFARLRVEFTEPDAVVRLIEERLQ